MREKRGEFLRAPKCLKSYRRLRIITSLGIFHNAAGKIDRTFEHIEIANVVFQGMFGTTAQSCGLNQAVPAERSDVVAVLTGEATDFAYGEVECCEQPHIEDRGIDALER